MKYFCKISHLCLVLALLASLPGLAQPVQASAPLLADRWVTNGAVLTTLLSGNTLYIGGDFTYVGPPTGSFAILDANGTPDRAFPPINGMIRAIAPDGAGGWYVGGRFSSVGGYPCNHLAHFKADKSLDFTWNPNPNDSVYAVVVAPPISEVSGSTIYVGGSFTSIGGQTRNYIAALDASSGNATKWDPTANNPVNALAVAPPASGVSGTTVYAGGGFTTIGGQTRNYIAALDATINTNNATSWDPNANSSMQALAVSGSTIYAGGDFDSIGGQTRNRIAALDATTGLATTWNPNPNSSVNALLVSGSTIYAGGFFTSIGGQARNHIAALDTRTGTATAWDPNANNLVQTLAVAPPLSGGSGSTVYAGGAFDSIGGQPRNHIAALDASTGTATAWNPNAGGSVYALAVAPPISGAESPLVGMSVSTVCAGGYFTSIGGQTRNRIAALDISTGLATTWDPNANSTVYTLAIIPPISGVSGSTVYAGGSFTSIGGQPRNRIAALDTGTGLATTWDPNASNMVIALAASDSTIYAGGFFTTIGGQTRNHIAAWNIVTGVLTTWDPNANSNVNALAIAPPIPGVGGNTVYTGGNFTNIGGQPRNRIAALDASTGLATAWDPNANSNVNALAVGDSTIYAGGGFTTINGGTPRNHIAALDASTGTATSWDPNANSNVNALVVGDSTIYAGGSFTTINGETPRKHIAALDVSTGTATAWNPNVDNGVITLTVAPPLAGGSGSMIYVGGIFTTIAGRPNSYLVALRDGAATCQSAASGGSWQASNWSNCGGTIPNNGDSVEVGHAITVYGNLATNDLTINASGELNLPLGSTLSVEGSLTNNGRLTQTLAVPTTTTFLNIKNATGSTDKYFGLVLSPNGDMGNTRVTIRGNQNCTSDPNDVLVKRCFEITPTTPRNATARFYYNYAELNGLSYNLLKAWRQSFNWLQIGVPYSYSEVCGAGQPDCWLEAQNLSVYSSFVLGSQIHVHPLTFFPLLRR